MSDKFNVNAYWLQRGQTYIAEPRLALEYYRGQEKFLFDVLRQGRVPMGTILELGCGFGRITKLLAGHFPEAEITALDLSPEQLQNARQYCAGRGNIQFARHDFYSGQPLPGAAYDTALAIEVFLHHPADLVRSLVERMAARVRFLVNLDWSESWPRKLPAHVWLHDYAALYSDAGLHCATFALPQRIEGKQQRLFVAGKILTDELVLFEQQWRDAGQFAPAETEPSADPNRSEGWWRRLHMAEQEILQLVPTNGNFILVDDDQWGETQTFYGHDVLPFLEKEGQYWGPPADNETAIRELARLRKEHAVGFIIFGWPAFWWLDYYQPFAEYLRANFRCVLQNERLVVFDLQNRPLVAALAES
jgi:SAM-dependent methyltransferase